MTAPPRLDPPGGLCPRHRQTYEAVFHLPTVYNLAWHEVQSLLDTVAELTESGHDSYRAVRAGQEVIFHSPQYKDFASPEDLLTLRRFLTQTSDLPVSDVLVVIDHHEARVYHSVDFGDVPDRISANDPTGRHGHLHSRHQETDGKRVRVRRRYLDAVATALRGADRILLFGSGAGESSAMDQLMTKLTDHHRDVANRVVGRIVIDSHHRTEHQLLAQAREYFAPAVG
jgi:hypothetical protein